jgi:hypothetical protein
LEKTLIESGLQFWNDHVLKNTPPPIDSSEQYASYLAKKFSLNPSDIVIDSTKDIEQWAQQLKHAQQQEKFAIEKAQLAKNHLMDLIGGHKGAKGDFGKITWIRPKPSPSTDYEAAFKALSDKYAAIVGIDAPAHVEEIAIAHTSPATKSAYLKATFSKER